VDCGIDCIDPIDPNGGMDIQQVKQDYGGRVCVKGNINCETTLVSGSEEEVVQEVKDCLRKAAYGGGHILSSSNSIHSGVKPENYRAMLRALRQHGTYPLKLEL
jgi:uroporphyrinogen decarboxylase